MTLTEIMQLSRGMLDDEQGPYLWKDIELVAYLNKSLNEFCEETEIIRDSITEAICWIAVKSGTRSYALDTRIIDIKRARLVTADRRVTKVTTTFLDRSGFNWDSESAGTGTPRKFMEDYNSKYLTFDIVPDADDTLKMTVVRLPLTQMSLSLPDAVPEIPFKYHYDLVDGILAKAYLKQDAETIDKGKAASHLGLWRSKLLDIKLKILNRNDIDNDVDQSRDYLLMEDRF